MNNKRTFKDNLRIIFKNIYVIFIIVLVSVGIFMVYCEKSTIYYESKGIILIKDKDTTYSLEKLNTFALYFKTRDLIDAVKEELKLTDSSKKLISNIGTKVIKDSNYIELVVKNENNVVAKKIIEKSIEKFEENFSKIYPELEVIIIDQPRSNDGYVRINTELYMYIVVISSTIIGIVIVLIFGNDDVSIKNHEDMEKYLGLKTLGIIPSNETDNITKKAKKLSLFNDNTKELDLKIIKDSGSLISESYRMVRTNLDFLDLKAINFTSTTASEGKSESISNIATAFAMIGKKTLLIDCDLRKPTLHRRFNLNRTLGFTDIIIYDRIETYEKYIQTVELPEKYKLDVITAGSKVSNPSELLSSPRFSKLLEKLKNDYDLILIDCPPVSLMTDAVIISNLCDGTAYIIEYDRLNYSVIKNSINQLKDVNSNVLGGVITKVNINKQKKLYGNKYEYYYSNYM